MEKLFGKYLNIKGENGEVLFYWNRFNSGAIILLVAIPMLILYGLANILGWDEINDTKVIPFSKTFTVIYWITIFLFSIHFIFNRKSTLLIKDGYVLYKKRRLTSPTIKFNLDEISNVDYKLVKNYGEQEIATMNIELFKLTIYLKNGKKIKLGSFNQEDCKLFKKELE